VYQVAFATPEGASIGSADISVVDGPPFPVTTHQTMNATFHGVHMEGSLDLTSQDEQGLVNEVSGDYTLTNPDTHSVFDLVTNNGVVSGSFDSTVDDGDEIDFHDIQVGQDLSTSAVFTTSTGTGNLTLNADGSGQTTSTDSHGTYTVQWTRDWRLTLIRPDGSTAFLGFVGNI
jgi:hypothetical protein